MGGGLWIRIRPAMVAALAIALLGTLVCLRAPVANGATATLADDGFRSDPDGYSFHNYGLVKGYRELTPAKMVRLFGPKACETFVNGRCRLLPTARKWMIGTNKNMSIGHCVGMAGTAQAFFEGIESPAPYGSPTVFDLGIEGNPRLQSHISYFWSFQLLPFVKRGEVTGTPAQVLARLQDSLRPGHAPFAVIIQDQDGGHAITPIAVDSVGPQKRAIRIYDNNHPGQTRAIHVDLATNRWTYDLGGGTIWSGNAKTKTLSLLPFHRGLKQQHCWFCSSKHGHRGKLQLQWRGDARSGAHSDLFIADGQKRRSGCGGNRGSFRCVNHIPGVQIWRLAEGAAPSPRGHAPLPTFRLPSKRAYRATLTSHRKGKPAREGLMLSGHGIAFDAHSIKLRRGDKARFEISHFGHRLRYRSIGGNETPTFSLATVTGRADYAFRIHASRIVRGAEVGLALHSRTHNLVIDATDAKRNGRYTLAMVRLHDKDRKKLGSRLRLRAGQQVVIHYGRWRHGHPPVTRR